MNSHIQWDDLKLARAVAEAGSLSGAARALGVSHATVHRRLNGLEKALGVRLFDRGPDGYVPTPAGEEAVAQAARMAESALEIERRVVGRDLRPSGTVRVTTTDSLLVGLLAPLVERFGAAHPEIRLELITSNRPFDLSRREADVAIRPGDAPPETLVGRRAGAIPQAIYAARSGPLAVDPARAPWIGADESMRYRALDRWMAGEGHDGRCVLRVDSVLSMQAAARTGLGVAALPLYLGDSDPALLRIGDPIPELQSDLWLLTHADLRRTARVRALLDFLYDALSGLLRDAR